MRGGVLEVSGDSKINKRGYGHVLRPVTEELETLHYRLYVHDSMYRRGGKLFTVILTAHHASKVWYFDEAFNSLLSQDNDSLEIILVDHGCELELSTHMWRCFEECKNSKLLVFPENHYDCMRADLSQGVAVVWNAALFASEGDYFYFLSYDDFLSSNYVGSMLRIFDENNDCVVATPKIVSVDEDSQINLEITARLDSLNVRDRYVDGLQIAYSRMQGDFGGFACPGGCCAYKTDMVLSFGGLDAMNDLSQIFRFAVMGLVGTDKDAFLYWRHHDKQTNNVNMHAGVLYYKLFLLWGENMLRFYSLNAFSDAYIAQFSSYYKNAAVKEAKGSIEASVNSGLWPLYKVMRRIMTEAPELMGHYYIVVLKSFALRPVRALFALLPQRVKRPIKALYTSLKGLSIN